MKKTLFVLVSTLALTLAGCSAEAATSAKGTYQLDKTAVKAAMLEKMPAEAKTNADAMKMVDSMVDGMNITITLNADGTATGETQMTMMGKETKQNATGTWKLDAGKLSMTMKGDDGKEETKVADYEGGKFSVEEESMGQKMKMTFVRK